MARSSRELGDILVACSRPVDGQAAIVEMIMDKFERRLSP